MFDIDAVVTNAIVGVEDKGHTFTQEEKTTINRFMHAIINNISTTDLQAIIDSAISITKPEPIQLDLFE